MGVFYVSSIPQIVPNGAKRLICNLPIHPLLNYYFIDSKIIVQSVYIVFFNSTCLMVIMVVIWSFSGLYFSAFLLNTEIYSISVHMQSKWGKMRTRKLQIGHFLLRKLHTPFSSRFWETQIMRLKFSQLIID